MPAESAPAAPEVTGGFSTGKVAVYLRVSTSQQDTAMQLAELEGVARQRGWELVSPPYEDLGFSGALASDLRPGLSAALRDARQGKFSRLAVWSVDRLGRSTSDLIRTLDELHQCKVEVYAHRQGIDTSTPTGRMMWQFLSIFADFEKEMIRERVRVGIERARTLAEAGGLPFKLGRPSQAASKADQVLALRRQKLGFVRIGRELGLGTSTVRGICQRAGL